MNRRITDYRLIIILSLLLAALVLGWRLIELGSLADSTWYWSHDGLRHPLRLAQFAEAFRAGIFYPRWTPDLMAGYGYPTFIFYQPALFYVALPFFYLLGNGAAAITATVVLMIWVGGVGAYLLARQWNGRGLSLAFALLFMLTPYAGYNIYTRGDFTEHFAMQLCPWSLHFGLRLIDAVRAGKPLALRVIAFVIATGMVIAGHPFVALFFLPFLAAMMATASITPKFSREALWVSMLALAATAAATMPYWLPLFQLRDLVQWQGASGLGLTDNLITYDNSAALLAALALFVYWRNPFVRVAAGTCCIYLLLMSKEAKPLWDMRLPLLQYVEFTWRIKATLATAALAGIAAAGGMLPQRLAYHAAAALLVMVSAVQSMQSYRAYSPLPVVDYRKLLADRTRDVGGIPYFEAGDRQLLRVDMRGLPNRPAANIPLVQMAPWAAAFGTVTMLPESTNFMPQAEARLTQAGAVLVNQLYFPGWRAEVNGQPADVKTGVNGRVRLVLPTAGTYRIKAWYDGPPNWRERNLIAAACLLVCSAGIYWRRVIVRKPGTRGGA